MSDLTPFQSGYLQSCLRFRERRPNFLNLVWQSVGSWLAPAVAAALGVILAAFGEQSVGYPLIAFGVGGLVITLKWVIRGWRLWPVQQTILDWGRVEHLSKQTRLTSCSTDR